MNGKSVVSHRSGTGAAYAGRYIRRYIRIVHSKSAFKKYIEEIAKLLMLMLNVLNVVGKIRAVATIKGKLKTAREREIAKGEQAR